MTYSGFLVSPGTQTNLYGGFNAIVSAVPGADWQTTGGAAITNSSALAIPPKFVGGHSRLVAAGVEMVNTTANLYKGGSITAYRSPSYAESGQIKFFATIPTVPPSTLVQTTPVECISLPPTTQAEAAIYTDSRTWSAEDGCYIIVAQSDAENPLRSLSPTDVLVHKAYDYSTVNAGLTANSTSQAWTSVIPGGSNGTGIGTGAHALPFENCGFICAGLNAQSTIQVTVRYYFERIPATTESDLLSMAQIPPAYDGVALEIYSRCLAQMPIGVPQNENPLGEWFTGILDTISSVAPKIGQFVSNLGGAISMVGGSSPSSSNATAQKNMTPAQRRQQQANLPKKQVMPPLPRRPNGPKKRKPRKKKVAS
jgi:hypothetical protein